ncbi:MAG: DUF1592 domain-containing protein, partial [Planctomycetota bacterium]
YVVRARVGRYPDSEERYQYLELSSLKANKQRDHLGWRKVTATYDDPEIIEFVFDHPPGEVSRVMVHQRTHQDRGDKALWTAARKENGFGLMPGLWVDWAEIELIEPLETIEKARHEILGNRSNDVSEADYVKDVMHRFARRIFRGRMPNRNYFNSLYDVYRDYRSEGRSIEQAILEPLAIMLASPEFLYMVNEGREDDSNRLAGIELANRLAFMLWSQPADKELAFLGETGKLDLPEVLREQVQRMLDDPRSKRFVRDFTHQWLQMDRLGMFQFNGLDFPEFDNAVREYGREEIFETVDLLMREGLPLGRLLNSDFVVVNDLLAAYYEIPNVHGDHFRKVQLGEDSIRGGLLGTAAVCAMGSDGLKTSPVERGVWVMRHLLNDPPAPAPPNVPQLSRLDGEILSAREIQQLHQEQPQCAQCHRKIDPIGFGLENFAADGRWREREEIKVGKRNSTRIQEFEIDPSGQLPSGDSFSNFQELRSLIGARDESFSRGFVEELIAYGLGRPFGFSDEALADHIIEETRESGFAIQPIIETLVLSESFQSK